MFNGIGIFIASLILVSIISLCFFKKMFWENRYIVLLLSCGLAMIVTVITNYAIRGKLNTKTETIWEKGLQITKFNDSLVDQNFFTKNKKLSLLGHIVGDDTTLNVVNSHILFYYRGKNLNVGCFNENNKSEVFMWKNVYIEPSESDTLAYLMKFKQVYDPKPNKWVAGFSLPRVKTIKCFYLPPNEYAVIPDSLIRKLPF